MDEVIHKSGGNVFADLDFDPGEAAVLQMRARLMADLQEFIINSELTQQQIAGILGIAQSRVSDLARNKWERFSLEMLVTLEARAGRRVMLDIVSVPTAGD